MHFAWGRKLFFTSPYKHQSFYTKLYIYALNQCNHVSLSCLLASRHIDNTYSYVLCMRVIVRISCTCTCLQCMHKEHIYLVICVCATHTKVCVPHGNTRPPAGGRSSHEELTCALCAQKCAHTKHGVCTHVCVRTHST